MSTFRFASPAASTLVGRSLVLPLLLIASASVLLGPSEARATTAAPAWQITTLASPTRMPTGIGRQGKYAIVVENVGGAPSSGPITIREVLPPDASASVVRLEPVPPGECGLQIGREITCTFPEPVVSSGFIVLNVLYQMTAEVGAGPLVNVASVSGGGAPPVVEETTTQVTSKPEAGPAGISLFRFDATGPAGEPASQAGGHPYLETTTALFNLIFAERVAAPVKPVQSVKDLVFYLPLGTLGNATVASTCPLGNVQPVFGASYCPSSSRLGTILPMILSGVDADGEEPTHESGIYNVPAEKGYPAEFAFGSSGKLFVLYASVVRHDGAYMTRVAIPGIPPVAEFAGSIASFVGDVQESTNASNGSPLTLDRGGFLTDPSDCEESGAARDAFVEANTWDDPSPELPLKQTLDAFPALEGCELQPFSAGLAVAPETTQAQAPSGYRIGLSFPQAPNLGSAIAAPPVRDVSVTLPEGTTISPPSANGLETCQETGPEAINIEGAESEAIGADGLEHPVAGKCPQASELGTVTATTPLLKEPLTGHLYLAAPECGGSGQPGCTDQEAEDGNLFRMYLELEAPERGVIIKLAGHATVNAQTGRVTVSFDEQPQFPLEEVNVTLTHGARAPLANPSACGAATSAGQVTSWSSGTPIAEPTSAFAVDWDGAGGACPATAPFAPSFSAFTTSPVAGASSPFSLTLGRADREQDVNSMSVTLPEGLMAYVPKVGRCEEPQASTDALNACPESSQIGIVTAAVGSGAEPYYVTGKVYLTGPYEGAPFGLSIVVPAVAGPFNLGDVLVRAKIEVNPQTTQITAESGQLPQKLDGVPLHIRTLNIAVNAHGFMANPTSCGQLDVTGTIASTDGATASVSSPFATSGCKYLAFKPSLGASTSSKTSKPDGASLTVKVAFPPPSPSTPSAEATSSPSKSNCPARCPPGWGRCSRPAPKSSSPRTQPVVRRHRSWATPRW